MASPSASSAGRSRPAGKALLAVGLLGLIAWQGETQLSDIDPRRLDVGLLPLLLLWQAGSAMAMVAAQGALLGVRRVVPGPGRTVGPAPVVVLRTSVVATALGYVLPGGPAVSAAYATRRYQQSGVPAAVAAQSQVATAAASGVSLGTLALAGALLPGAARNASLHEGPHTVLVVLAATMLVGSLALAAVLRSTASRDYLARSRLVAFVTGCPVPGPDADRPPALSTARLAAATGLTAVSQLCDVACLVMALTAAEVPIPWLSLLLAYGAAQLLGLVPLTPGGVGLLEGGLGALLVVPTAPSGAVALAVVTYRAFSWGAWVLAGAVSLLVLRRGRRRAVPVLATA